jgi:hypothetical protein
MGWFDHWFEDDREVGPLSHLDDGFEYNTPEVKKKKKKKKIHKNVPTKNSKDKD